MAVDKEEEMRGMLVKLALRWLGRKLDGKTTFILSAGKVCFAIAILISYAYPEYSFLPEDPDKALELIGAVFGGLFGASTATQRRAIAKTEKKVKAIQDSQLEEKALKKFINPGHEVK